MPGLIYTGISRVKVFTDLDSQDSSFPHGVTAMEVPRAISMVTYSLGSKRLVGSNSPLLTSLKHVVYELLVNQGWGLVTCESYVSRRTEGTLLGSDPCYT